VIPDDTREAQKKWGLYVRAIPALAALLLLVSGGCAPEVTTPQGAAATARVVPMAMPDKWCPAVADTTPEDKRR